MDWTKEKIEERKFYIGGSDAAAILGLSRWRTPLQVWAIKTGQVPPADINDKVAVKLGNKLEQTVAEFFMEETGKKLERVNETLYHPKYPFIGANIDRRVVGERAGFEVKTTNQFKASEWEGEEIPQEYQVQCLHYMAVTGLPVWYLACLVGNMQFVWKVFVRSDYAGKADLPKMPKEHINLVTPETLKSMITKEVNFWNNFVLTKEMPMTITSEDSDVLYKLFPKAGTDSVIELGDDISKICESLYSMKADKKVLEAEIEEHGNRLRAALKTFEVGLTPKYKISWRNQSERRIDVDLLKKEEPGIYEKYAPPKDKRVLRLSVRR